MGFGHICMIFSFSPTSSGKVEANTVANMFAYLQCFRMMPGARSGKMQLIGIEKADATGEADSQRGIVIPLSAIRQSVLIVPHMDSIFAKLPVKGPTTSEVEYRRQLLQHTTRTVLTAGNVLERCSKFVVCEALHLTNFFSVYTGRLVSNRKEKSIARNKRHRRRESPLHAAESKGKGKGKGRERQTE